MSVRTINEAERTRASQQLRERPMSSGVRRAEMLGGGVFLLAASALALLAGRFSLMTAALYVLGIAVASNVRFDVGSPDRLSQGCLTSLNLAAWHVASEELHAATQALADGPREDRSPLSSRRPSDASGRDLGIHPEQLAAWE
jgi:hypothetical protein